MSTETKAAVDELKGAWQQHFEPLAEQVKKQDHALDEIEARLQKMGLDADGGRKVATASHNDLIGKGESFADALEKKGYDGPGAGPQLSRRDAEEFSLGRMIAYMAKGDERHLTEVERKGAQGAIGPDGGWLIPDALIGPTIDLARNKSRVFEAGARIMPMAERTVRLPRLESDAAATWRSEGSPVNEDDPEFGHVTLELRTLAVMTKISFELIEDLTPAGYSLLEGALLNGVGLGLDYAVLRGIGTLNAPMGISTDPLVPDSSPLGTPTSYDCFIDAMASVWGYNGTPNAAIYSARTAATFAKLKTGISGDKTQLTMPREVAALQHLVTNQIPNNINTDDSEIVVGDFSKVVVGVKPNISVRLQRYDGAHAGTMQALLLAYIRADVGILEPTHFHVTRGVDD